MSSSMSFRSNIWILVASLLLVFSTNPTSAWVLPSSSSMSSRMRSTQSTMFAPSIVHTSTTPPRRRQEQLCRIVAPNPSTMMMTTTTGMTPTSPINHRYSSTQLFLSSSSTDSTSSSTSIESNNINNKKSDDTDDDDDEEDWEYVEFDTLTESDLVGSEWLVGTCWDTNPNTIDETWCRLVTNPSDGTNLVIWGDNSQGKWSLDVATQYVTISKTKPWGKQIWACLVEDYYYMRGTVRGWTFWAAAAVEAQWQAKRLGVDPEEAGIAPWFEDKDDDDGSSSTTTTTPPAAPTTNTDAE